jgi:hypothetical protein
VSIELTTQMLATLFDYPQERRRELTRWSDIATEQSITISDSYDEETALSIKLSRDVKLRG